MCGKDMDRDARSTYLLKGPGQADGTAFFRKVTKQDMEIKEFQPQPPGFSNSAQVCVCCFFFLVALASVGCLFWYYLVLPPFQAFDVDLQAELRRQVPTIRVHTRCRACWLVLVLKATQRNIEHQHMFSWPSVFYHDDFGDTGL